MIEMKETTLNTQVEFDFQGTVDFGADDAKPRLVGRTPTFNLALPLPTALQAIAFLVQ